MRGIIFLTSIFISLPALCLDNYFVFGALNLYGIKKHGKMKNEKRALVHVVDCLEHPFELVTYSQNRRFSCEDVEVLLPLGSLVKGLTNRLFMGLKIKERISYLISVILVTERIK